MKSFIQWVESVVAVRDINNAIGESVKLIVGGKWNTEEAQDFRPLRIEKKSGPVGSFYNCQKCRINMLGVVDKGVFWLSAFPEVRDEIANYDSKTGSPSLTIEADLFGRSDLDLNKTGGFKKIDTSFFHTPYELARWVKDKIDNFREDDGDSGGWEDAPIDPNLEPELVPVGSRRR